MKVLHDDTKVLRDDITVNDALRLKEHEEAMKPFEEQFPRPQLMAGASDYTVLQQAYEGLKQEQKGVGTVYIADLIAKSGLSKGRVHEIIQQAALEGDASLSQSSIAAARLSKEQIEGALNIEGDIYHTVTFKDVGPKPSLAPDMTRRGFLKGAAATGVAAATGKVPKLGEVAKDPFAGLAEIMNEQYQKNMEHLAAEFWQFYRGLQGRISPEIAKLVSEELRAVAKHRQSARGLGENKIFNDAAKLIDSGWVPSTELLDSFSKVGKGEGIEPSEMTKKMVSEDGLRPSEAAELGNLPWPEEYMKGDYPKGLIEPSPREAMRRHQEAIDEVREASRLRPSFAKAREVNLEITGTFDLKPFEDQSGNKHPAGKLLDIDLKGAEGESLGSISVATGDEFLHVDYAHNATFQPWQQGFNQMEVMLRTAKELYLMFPETKGLGGHLVSRDKYVQYTWGELFGSDVSPGKELTAGDLGPKATPIKLGPSRPTGIIQTKTGKRFTTDSVGSITIRDAVAQIDFGATVGGPIGGALDAIARKVAEKAASTPIHIIKDAEWKAMMEDKAGDGQYDPISNTVAMPERIFTDPTFERTILHEIVHAATAREIIRNPELRLRIEKLMNEVSQHTKGEEHYGLTEAREFLSESNSNPDFQRRLFEIKVTPELAKELGVRDTGIVKSIWDTLIELIAKALGLESTPEVVTALEAAMRVSQEAFDTKLTLKDRIKMLGWKANLAASEEVSIPPTAQPTAFHGPKPSLAKQPELPGMTRMEDRPAFTPIAVGINKEWYQRYQELIAKQQGEDAKRRMEVAIKRAEQIQTKEWKDAQDRISKEVEAEVRKIPGVNIDEALRKGSLGEDISQPGGRRFRLNSEDLTEEQKAVLSKSEYSKDGMNVDDVASFFGYSSGSLMIERLGQFRVMANETYASTEALVKAVTREQTAMRMEQEFGDLGKKILEEARDHVLSETQLDLMHEEILGLAMQAKMEFTLTKDQMKKLASDAFDKHKLSNAVTTEYLRLAAKHGIELEKALLVGDARTALKAKQMQTFATMMAKEAERIEKAQKSFTRTTKRFQPREVKGFEQEYTDHIQKLLVEAGLPVRRDLAEINESLGRRTPSELGDFIESKNAVGWELTAHDSIILGPPKPFADMTVGEFKLFKEAIDSLAYVGRKERQIEVGGQAQDFAEWKEPVVENIISLPKPRREGVLNWLYKWDSLFVRMEEMVKDLDLRKELGPLWDALIHPMAEAKHTEYQMTEKLTKDLIRIKGFDKKWRRTLDDQIPNNFFYDPDGVLFNITRQSMINIMLNFGTRSNIDKFTRGWAGKEKAAAFENSLRSMFEQHATKADWDFAQNIWDLFEGWKGDSDRLYRDLSGVAPKWIPAEAVQTPHGNYRGGYFPVIYDKYWSNINLIQEAKSADQLFGGNYFRATTPNGYAKERTGYVDRVMFENSMEQLASRMQQQIHDISYRRAVINVSKVINDRQIRGAIRRHYGEAYEAQLDPWLKDIANHFNQDEKALAAANSFLRRVRFNLITNALGFNLKVIGSPDVGKLNPAVIARVIANRKEDVALAHEKSREIPHTFRNMDRDFRERLEQTMTARGWNSFQMDAMRWGFWPTVKFSQGFRIATFVEAYKDAKARGLSEGEAVSIADSLVRERHGAAGLPDLPKIMRSNEAMKTMTMFYGYFSTMYNWQRQIPGQIRRGEFEKVMGTVYGSVLLPAAFGALLFNQVKEQDSWFKVIAKAIALQPLSTLPYARDAANWAFEGFSPRSPFGSLLQSFQSVYRDIVNHFAGKKVAKPIQHTGTMLGLAVGLPLGQVSRTGQFFADYFQGKQKPRNFYEWFRGIVHGEARLKK
jgi:hypothetical protein